MNTWQCARQIRHKLLARQWPDSPQGTIFGSVFVTQSTFEDINPASIVYPAAIVRVLDSQTDPDDQRYQVQRFEVVILVKHSGDQFGEAAMIGGNRTSQGGSGGRGVLEVEEQVREALQFLDPLSAVRLQLVSSGAADCILAEGVGYIVGRPMTFQARLTTNRVYPAPNFGKTLTSSVLAGTVSLSWLWSERFDLHAAATAPRQLTSARGLLTLVRKAGATPPASVSDGTLVTLASNASTSATDSPGTGTWSYALFAQYDEFGDATGTQPLSGTSVRTSTSATASGIVV